MAGSRYDPDDISDFRSKSGDDASTLWTPVFILQRIKREVSCVEANSLLLIQGGRSIGVCSPHPSK